jgi:hypothetical protein
MTAPGDRRRRRAWRPPLSPLLLLLPPLLSGFGLGRAAAAEPQQEQHQLQQHEATDEAVVVPTVGEEDPAYIEQRGACVCVCDGMCGENDP